MSRAQRPVFMFTREGIRAVDRAAIEEYGIPGIVLMENAAAALLAPCLTLIDHGSRRDPAALILCGPGNNGGDGFALARRLSNEGIKVRLLLASPRGAVRGDAATNLGIVERMGLAVEDTGDAAPAAACDRVVAALGRAALVVDALFGTGLDRPLGSPSREIVAWVNSLRARPLADRPAILSVDIPSGLDCDSGSPLGGDPEGAVRADLTVTLAGLKAGFGSPGSDAYLGEVVVGDIGAPVDLLRRFSSREGGPGERVG